MSKNKSDKMTDRPYRRCVGAMVLNGRGDVFMGKRKGAEGLEFSWQMPQGGIDDGEVPLDAARRELEEETAIRSVELLAEYEDWLSYDLPEEALGRWKGKYRGQTQKWYVFRFQGDEGEIDLKAHEPAEFVEWKWVALPNIVDLVVSFKRPVYEALVRQFSHLSRQSDKDH